jgi:peroxiredoxin
MTDSSANALRVGAIAPDFSLASTSGETVSLSAFRNRRHVLLAFFPAAFTGVCTSEMCAFSEDFDAFQSADVEVLPISVDAIPSLKEFRSKYDMKVQLLSDFQRHASTAFGTLWRDSGFSNRAYFLIDKAGVVRWAHLEENPGQVRSNEEILNILKTVM